MQKLSRVIMIRACQQTRMTLSIAIFYQGVLCENVIFIRCQEFEIPESDVQPARFPLRYPPDLGQAELEKLL